MGLRAKTWNCVGRWLASDPRTPLTIEVMWDKLPHLSEIRLLISKMRVSNRCLLGLLWGFDPG